jgi:hypothetical protein
MTSDIAGADRYKKRSESSLDLLGFDSILVLVGN